jgi:uncharacterized protein (DUF302 family)
MSTGELRKVFAESFDVVLERVSSALASEGFGVLTRIDVQETMRQKLGVDFERYQILGACNPGLAHRALAADREVGLLLPCNVIIYQSGDHEVNVSIFDPMSVAVDRGGELLDVAQQARRKLERVIELI